MNAGGFSDHILLRLWERMSLPKKSCSDSNQKHARLAELTMKSGLIAALVSAPRSTGRTSAGGFLYLGNPGFR